MPLRRFSRRDRRYGPEAVGTGDMARRTPVPCPSLRPSGPESPLRPGAPHPSRATQLKHPPLTARAAPLVRVAALVIKLLISRCTRCSETGAHLDHFLLHINRVRERGHEERHPLPAVRGVEVGLAEVGLRVPGDHSRSRKPSGARPLISSFLSWTYFWTRVYPPS